MRSSKAAGSRAAGPDRFDVAVVGAGPAGSVTAFRLASAGASVALLDRARFPRDKPCGGGVTVRAARRLPFSITPVVEEVIDEFELGFAYRDRVGRRTREPLVFMTQRRRLDAYLAERAAEAGADFRQGTKVDAIDSENGGRLVVRTSAGPVEADVVVGADGANGVSARSLGLCDGPSRGVALEGNLPYSRVDRSRYRHRAIVEIGTVPGGYAWVFPKGEHLNFGVGGWGSEGPHLRRHLASLCEAHGVSVEDLHDLRGHRLPSRQAAARLAGLRSLVVGDAAGLVDPWTGDGMFEAFASAGHAAAAIRDLLAGDATSLDAYEIAVRRDLDLQTGLAWDVKMAHERAPRLFFMAARTGFGFRLVERFLRRTDDDRVNPVAHALARAALAVVSRAVASPGGGFRRAAA